MWMEYVRKSLAEGHQVFRRSVIEKLINEIETEYEQLGVKHLGVKDMHAQLERSRRANRVLSAKLAHIKAILEETKE
jgi:hypothetical protein